MSKFSIGDRVRGKKAHRHLVDAGEENVVARVSEFAWPHTVGGDYARIWPRIGGFTLWPTDMLEVVSE